MEKHLLLWIPGSHLSRGRCARGRMRRLARLIKNPVPQPSRPQPDVLGALTLDEAYRLTSGPLGYVVIIAAIATLVGREMLRTTGKFPLRPAAGIAAAVLTVSAFAIIGVRLAALAN